MRWKTPRRVIGASVLWLAAAASSGFAQTTEPSAAGNWLWRLYEAGGLFMHPILLCAVVAGAVAMERAWSWWRDRRDLRRAVPRVLVAVREGANAGAAVAEAEGGPLGRVVAHGLARAAAGREAIRRGLAAAAEVELFGMERGLLWLATVANVAPLLGFLGTVSGMIRAFRDIAAADRVSAQVVAAGIAEALLTTAFGLLVAIPAQVLYNLYLGRVDRFAVVVAEVEEDVLYALESRESGERP